MTSLVYRYMRKEDLEIILEIERYSNPHPWTEKNFQDCLDKDYYCLIQEYEGEVSGFSIQSINSEESHLLNIGIVENLRRRGLGREILSQVTNVSKIMGSRRIFLEVRPSNLLAIKLYEQEGFKRLKIRKDYYRLDEGREDALIMVKKLKKDIRNFFTGDYFV